MNNPATFKFRVKQWHWKEDAANIDLNDVNTACNSIT